MLDHSLTFIVLQLCRIGYLVVLVALLQAWPYVRSNEPKSSKKRRRQPPADLTEIPPCPACEAERGEQEPASAPAESPPRIEHERGARRRVDTSSHYCPNSDCRYHGWPGLGNIRSNGYPNGGRWRQLECTVCGTYFSETRNTIFYCKKVPAQTIWQALTALAEGLGIRKTARVFGLDPNTVESWLRQAAEHVDAVSHYMTNDLQLSQVQVDELWALLGRRDEQAPSDERQRAVRWVWAGIDPVSKLMLACVVGDRSRSAELTPMPGDSPVTHSCHRQHLGPGLHPALPQRPVGLLCGGTLDSLWSLGACPTSPPARTPPKATLATST